METTPVTQPLSRLGLVMAVLLIGLAPAFGQTDLEQMTKPKTVPEFWRHVQFQLSQGKFDRAADFLKSLLAASPTDKDLLGIAEREGVDKFLNLRNVQKWSDDPKLQAEAKQNVEKLIAQVSEARKKLLTDPDRITRFIKNLSGSAEEREYAIVELQKSGTAIMPTFIGTLVTADPEDRQQLLSVLPLLEADTVPAVLATLDIENPSLRLDLMSTLIRRADLLRLMGRSDTDPRPSLWFLAAKTDLVGTKAREILATLMGVPVAKLATPESALIKSADQVYQHKTTYAKAAEAPLTWKWDGKKLDFVRGTVSQTEEFYGLRYARWALDLEPNNETAQALFLSIATEKAMERGGIDQRLAQSSPAVHELLSLAPAATLYTMLEKAMSEGHLAVSLGVTQVLGERAEGRGAKAGLSSSRTGEHGGTSPGALVLALNSKDRRLSLAAADALIRLPGLPSHQVSARIVEVYRAALANVDDTVGAANRPKALIADADNLRADLLAATIRQAGYDTVVTHTGRDTLKRLSEASDLDVLWIDPELPYPELPYLLAQVRSDFRHGLVPIFVCVSPDAAKAILPEIDSRLDRLKKIVPELKVDEKSMIRVVLSFDALNIDREPLDLWLSELHRDRPTIRTLTDATLLIKLVLDRSKESEAEMLQRTRDMTQDLSEIRVKQDGPTRFTFSMDGTKPVPEALENRLTRLQRDFPNVRVTRELPTKISLTSNLNMNGSIAGDAKLARTVQPYKYVQIVHRPATPDSVKEEMQQFIADIATRPLSDAERKDQQRRAVDALRRMAVGELPGYDIRPAVEALRTALRSDDLAPAAIDAVATLPGKTPQQDLADLTLDAARPVLVRVKAAGGLTRHIQTHDSGPLSDAQIRNLVKTYETDKSPEVRAAVATVLGILPQDRVVRNQPDDAARQKWTNRLQKYEPMITPPAPPAPPADPKPDPKPDDK